jgi:4-amino-4-deoxy-L-arabinose transferase-like glycosyltransferase
MDAYVLRAGKLVPRARGRAIPRAAAPVLLALITALGAALRLWDFGHVGANPFYDAAVRSMSLSWHNFFFGVLEPGGQVSVDKAPADLWLQVAAVKLFGFSGVVVRLPEVLAGIAAIPLLYDLVRRLFGVSAGIAAAAALAVLPAAILTAHSDTMDSLMMLCDVGAAWLVVYGARRGRLWPIAAAGAVLGLAFNVKLFEALVVAPALLVLIALAVAGSLRRRALAIGAALLALVTVGGSWIAAASLLPLGHRPWPFGSADGSIVSAVFAYNGVDRLRGSASAAALKLDPPGPLRLLSSGGHDYLATVGTMLIAAIVLPALALALHARSRRGASRLAVAGGIFFAVWLLTGVALVSHMQRLEPRYLETVTAPIAAAVGIGAVGCAHALASRRRALLSICCVAAVLAVPAASALTVAARHRSDAGLASRMSPAQLQRLSSFLRGHDRAARYELASSSIDRATSLIARDGRPVLMLTGEAGRALVSPARLAALVASGSVRYGLLARGSAPVLSWALHHGRDVGGAARLPAGTLYRLTATAPPPATARIAPRAARRRG